MVPYLLIIIDNNKNIKTLIQTEERMPENKKMTKIRRKIKTDTNEIATVTKWVALAMKKGY